MYGGILHKFRHRVVAAGNDVTPNSVDWSNIEWDDLNLEGTVTSQQISGITSSITIKITRGSGAADLYYRVGNSNLTGTIFDAPFFVGYTLISNNGTFSVSNNQWVTFACYGEVNSFTTTVTVLNNSDGDATLDTFTIRSIGP